MTKLFYVVNKKVLLRERKRHTARRVVNTPSVVLTGYPPHPDLAGGVPDLGNLPPGYPPARVPPPGYPPEGYPLPPGYPLPGYPHPLPGYPPGGYPCQGTPLEGTPARVPPWRVPLPGYPPGRVPPHQGTPTAGPTIVIKGAIHKSMTFEGSIITNGITFHKILSSMMSKMSSKSVFMIVMTKSRFRSFW